MARINGLDLARGIAIWGTLATNIWIFSHPGGMLGYLAHQTTPGAGPAQASLERLLMALAQGKFLGLLTIMFGIGLAIQHDSAVRKGTRWPGGYPVRAGLLFLEGLLHFALIAEFDVLMGYAITAIIVSFIVATAPRTQRIWLAVCSGIHLLIIGALTAFLLATPAPSAVGDMGSVYRTGSWWDLVVLRLDQALLFRIEPIMITALSIAMFLAGGMLYRAGIFEERGARVRTKLMVLGAVALPLDLLLALTVPNTIMISRYLLAPAIAAGMLAVIAHFSLRGEPGWLGRRATEVGRTALSCYIGQNLIASIVFYGWGFGLNAVTAATRPWVTIGAYLGLCALLCVLAHLWLRRFRRGPAEWLWTASYSALTAKAPEKQPTRV